MTKNMSTSNQEKIRVPAPILTILHLIIAILLRNLLPLPISVPALLQWLGLGLAAVGFVLGVLALNEFKRARAAYDPKKPTSGFVTAGIYHYTRNPVYLGFVLILIGLSLSMGTYWGIVLAWPLMVFMNNLVIKPEEVSLEKNFKNQYLEYKANVRRWL
jgi:protein-S-isoprenylcysteine O-methyltransferase Ste14